MILFHLFSHFYRPFLRLSISSFIRECCSSKVWSSPTDIETSLSLLSWSIFQIRIQNQILSLISIHSITAISEISFLKDKNCTRKIYFYRSFQILMLALSQWLISVQFCYNMQAQTHPVQYLDFWKGTSRRTRKYPEVYIKKASFLEELAQSEQGIGAEVIEIEDTPEEANGIRQDGLGGFTQEHAITIIEEEPEVMEVQKSQRELLTLLEGSTSSAKKSHTTSYFQQELAYLNNPPASKSQTSANLANKKVEQAPAIFYQEVSAIFCNCKISLSMKDIHEYSEAQALIIPFESSQLELYPGCWLRDELASQCEKLSKAEIIDGGIYIKRKTGIHNYNYLVFLKVQLEEFSNNLKIGLNLLLKKIRNDSKDISSMVLCLQEGIDVGSILEGLTKSSQLRKCNHLNLNLSCKDQSRFQEQFKRFLKLTR